MLESPAGFVPLTVTLEFEWVMRGFYEVATETFCETVEHLLGMPHVTVERWEAVKDALDVHRKGLDFADARGLQQACSRTVTFDDWRFVRRANRLTLVPEVTVPR